MNKLSNSHYDQNLADSRLGRANDLAFGCISPTFQHFQTKRAAEHYIDFLQGKRFTLD
jgi:hypothetical protein